MIDSSPYAFKDFPGSSHWLLIRAIRRSTTGKEVLLDVGAAGGELASRLGEDFERLVGIEGDPARVPDLSRHFDTAMIADLNALDRLPASSAIVLADIIEHLPDPGRFLRLSRAALSDDGLLYLSVPNVANVTVRLGLLTGRWDYADRGILDRTHLRFYTRRTILAELRENGFEPVRVEATTMPIRLVLEGRVPETILRFCERSLLPMTRFWPTLFGYQWVITAKPA